MNPKAVEERVLEATQIIEDQVDAAIEKLDKLEDEDLIEIQRKRADALRREMKMKEDWIKHGHAEYTEIPCERDLFDVCKKSKNVVCHFYRSSTFRCKIVDKHLAELAPKHIETKFCKIDAEKSPFLTDRLKVRVLPTIVLFKDAINVDYIIGFDDLGGTDDFTTAMMERRLAKAGVINYDGDLSLSGGTKPKNPLLRFQPKKNIRGGASQDSDSD